MVRKKEQFLWDLQFKKMAFPAVILRGFMGVMAVCTG
jgi:hypothetical protein